MSERIGNIVIIKVEKPQQCDLCSIVKELRPYGLNKECICFECMQEVDPEIVDQRMNEHLFSATAAGAGLTPEETLAKLQEAFSEDELRELAMAIKKGKRDTGGLA